MLLLFGDWSLPFHKGKLLAGSQGQVCPLRGLGVSGVQGLPLAV